MILSFQRHEGAIGYKKHLCKIHTIKESLLL